MTTVNHEQVFLEFVKHHDDLQHLSFSDVKVKNQKIIGLLETEENDDFFIPFTEKLVTQNDVLIDPNWDEICNSFFGIKHNEETVDYIKDIVDAIETKEEVLEFLLTYIIKPLIDSNINANKVYFRIKPNWNTDWCDTIIEVK
jgi:hypothetical protein